MQIGAVITQLPEGKKFYGSVTVGEGGQIVLPAEARRGFVFGDRERGLGIATLDVMRRMIEGAPGLFRGVGLSPEPESEESSTEGDAE